MTQKLPYWLAVEESKLVQFSELPHMMALALHPDDSMAYGCARVNLEADLPRAVINGDLLVRDPLSLGRHTFPHGDALKRAVMLPNDLKPFLAGRGIELRLIPHGSGPEYWTLENAAVAIAEQENWHQGTRAEFLDDILRAAKRFELVTCDPRTTLTKTAGEVRQYYELVTPDAMNAWLSSRNAAFRWTPQRSPDASFPWPREMHGEKVWRLREAIADIAENAGATEEALMARVWKGLDDGTLKARDLPAGGIPKKGDNLSGLVDYFFSSDINSWLDSIGAPFSYRLPKATNSVPPTAQASADFTMLATREELVTAFGTFTGMTKAWFDNLRDSPALLAARKHAGQGGRGHIREPYFCPLEVMLWLTSSKRKKGRSMSAEKGWQLLEQHFPRVYAAHSAADPRTD